jgi:hypothetical protein
LFCDFGITGCRGGLNQESFPCMLL